MSRRTILLLLGAVALVAVVVVGLSQTKGTGDAAKPQALSPAEIEQALAGSPPRLAALHSQANQLLDGSTADVEKRIASLKGLPVVVNMWGSWCGPCRFEAPFLQKASLKYGKHVAFLGLNVTDPVDAARKELKANPVAYPSYIDGNARAATKIAGGVGLPITVFYTPDGKQQIHQGVYASQADLDQDIQRYALGS